MTRGRKPIYGKFRIETLEDRIALATARKQHDAINALRSFARAIRVPLNEQNISEQTVKYITEINRFC